MRSIKSLILRLADLGNIGVPDYMKKGQIQAMQDSIIEELEGLKQEYGQNWRKNSAKFKFVEGYNIAIQKIQENLKGVRFN